MNQELEEFVDELQAFCARHSLHWAVCRDPDTGKLGVLLAHAKSVSSMRYMEMEGQIDPVVPKALQ